MSARRSETVVGDPEKPGKDRLFRKLDIPASTPRLKEDNTGEILGYGPFGGASEAVVVHRSSVAIEELSEGPAVVSNDPLPELGVRRILGSHILTMSGRPR